MKQEKSKISEGGLGQRIRIETLTPLNREDDLSEIRTGLMKTPREISSKFFYDSRGSALFEPYL